jgi:hypothetical protein
MKMRSKLLLTLILLSLEALSQERLDDLVPFKKGKSWGIVHHDGKAFFPATLDTVLWTLTDKGNVLFSGSGEKACAKVVKGGKAMYLRANKKLDPAEFSITSEYLTDENRVDIMQMDQEGMIIRDEVTVAHFTTPKNNKKVEIKTQNFSTYTVYVNGVEIPEMECNQYVLDYDQENKMNGIILIKDLRYAYADMETGNLSIPFSFLKLAPYFTDANWIVAEQSGLKGIVTKNGNPVTSIRYSYLREVFYQKAEKLRPIIVGDTDEGNRYFLFPEKDSASKIKYDYLYEWNSEESRETFFLAHKNNRAGFVNAADKVLVPFIYDEIKRGPVARFSYLVKKGKHGLVDHHRNHFRNEPAYDEILEYFPLTFNKSGLPVCLFLVKKGTQVFYVDNFGKEFLAK